MALIGRPNVGKSSLLNKLAGENRVVVDNVAGTTRDPVDEFIELGGKTWRFVDTAGIRRRVHQTRGADFYASLRTQTALEKAEVAVVLIDAEQSIAEQDIRVVQQVIDAGRALVVAYNKWDLLDEERRYYLEREIERELVQIPWAPRVNISARTGRTRREARAGAGARSGVLGLPRADRAGSTRSSARSSPPTRTRCVAASSPASCSRRRPATRPPRFVIFASGFIEAGLPPVPRAAAARGVRLRGHADRGVRPRAREAPPEVGAGARHTDFKRGMPCARVSFAPAGPASAGFRVGKPRAVAQLGSALDWGSRGRRFKSCQPDRSGPDLFRQVRARFHARSGRPGRCRARVSPGTGSGPPGLARAEPAQGGPRSLPAGRRTDHTGNTDWEVRHENRQSGSTGGDARP